jgi:UDP-3-O-acyl N-acetylglucosamine deacetylase
MGASVQLHSDSIEIALLPTKQRTLRHPVQFSGIGLHTGLLTDVVIRPASVDYGIRFSRGDSSVIPPKAVFSYQSNHTTSVNAGGSPVMCVEHLMSCLHVLGITNADVHFVVGEEFPIFDGSAIPILIKLLDAGIAEQRRRALGLFIRRPFFVQDDEGRAIWACPGRGFVVHAEIDFRHPIDRQNYSCEITETTFKTEIASARTFLKDSVDAVPLDIVRSARLRGLRGPPVDSCPAIVYNNQRYLSRLRFRDEAVRHKILDFLGDIYTLGYQVQGQFSLVRPGHAFSLRFVELLRCALSVSVLNKTHPMAKRKIDTAYEFEGAKQNLERKDDRPFVY